VTDDLRALILGGGLLAAFWSGTSAVLAGARQTNETRDRIVHGKIGTDRLPEAYLRRVLLFDWLPMKFGLAGVSVMLGIIIVLLPEFAGAAPTPKSFFLACYMTAFVPFAGFLSFVVSTVVEFRFMIKVIRQRGAGDSGTPG
jgi:hypothetical protein